MPTILIKNGRVVSPSGMRLADVRIADGKIEAVGRGIEGKAERTIDATDLFVLPGLIDPHTHPVYLDDLGSLPVSAAYGGVTTLIHYAYAKPGEGLIETIERFREEGLSVSILDFALHGGLFDPKNQAEEIPEAHAAGVTSYKMFMTYAKLGWMTDDYQLMRTFDIIGQVGGMGMVHAENGLATDYLEDRMLEQGEDPRENFVATRPAILEAEAIHRAIALAQVAGCPIYIPHMTARLGIEEVARARKSGFRVYAETCPQYLTLTEEELRRQGPLVKIGPPLRSEDDRRSLWTGIAYGTIDTVASDHAAKEKKIDDAFFDAPYGSPQVETMLPLVYDGGVNSGWITISRLVEVMCENPARIFGLYPKKGALLPGSDGDVVLFDPNAEWTIERSNQHSNAPYTAYEGRRVLGRVVMTIGRGEVLVEEGELKGEPGRAEFLKTESGRVAPESLFSHRIGR